MADDKLIQVHRGENGGVTKWIKPKDLAKNKAAGYTVAPNTPEPVKKPAAKPASEK
jgi:hypothetical protein